MGFKCKGSIGKGASYGKVSKTVILKKGGNLMNPIINRDSDNLKMQAERIKQDLAKLKQDEFRR